MRLIYVVFCVLALICGVWAHDEDVHTIRYTDDNFMEELPKKNHFVMFYAPWCGHCQRLGPTWEQLAEMLNEDEDSNLRIAKVDCTTDNKVCADQDVTGYPTLKFFKVGDTDGVKFRGTRDLPTLTTFINEQLREGDEEMVGQAAPQQVLVELTENNFDELIGMGKHFVKFYAPWCGHCQKLAPTWEELAKSLEFEKDITISKIDCTVHRTICNTWEIKGYPSLVWFEDGKKVDKYQGSRSHEDLKAYVNKMLGGQEDDSEAGAEKPSGGEEIVSELNGSNFQHGIEKGLTFVKFFAPWCGHCKRLAPTWEELGKKFIASDLVNIVKVDCTLEVNKGLCREEAVEGFPTIFLYKDGAKISEYNGNRSLEDMFSFVSTHLPHDEL